jgi:DNA (cytosine-5)-methyltransferase 1
MSLRVGALCAGYGGLELGLSHMGVDTELVWVSETEKYASAVLDARFGVPNLGDLTEIADPPRVDAVTAGFPCESVSNAGRRAGINDERWLIRDVVTVARRAGAQWIFMENVRGVLTANQGDAFGQVLDALADGGFDAEWACVRADQSVGACHRRDRWFCVAHASGAAGEERDFGPSTRVETSRGDDPSGRGVQDEARAAADAKGTERRGEEHETVVAPVGSAPKPGERHSSSAWGDYADAINRWEWAIGRAAPKPVTDDRLLSSRFVEWMMGLPDGWVTGVGLSRSQELKILGNGVMPQQAAAAYGWLLEQWTGAKMGR